MSLRSKTASSNPSLRPCQTAYLGESNARRLLKRSQLSKKIRAEPHTDEPILDLHEEAAALEAVAAAATSIPCPPIGYSVECYATHAEDEARRRTAAFSETEKRVLFNSINSSRHAEGQRSLRLKSLLCKYAQDHADTLFNEDLDGSKHANTATATSSGNHNSVVVVMAPSGARVARLVSPTKIGALACGEMWYGGKYKRHLYSMDGVNAHPEDCPCHLRMVFETMVDEGWRQMGIGRGEDGRWVVELSQ